MKTLVMALIIMLVLASASFAADPIALGPAGGPGHEAAAFCSGGSQVFTVSAAGSGLTYQWMLGGVAATGDGATTASYTAVAPGAYTVVVSGTCGTPATSEIGTVPDFLPPTVITAGPVGGDICAGTAGLTLSVTASGQGTLTYQWYKDGTTPVGTDSSTYTVTESGSYTVKVHSACGDDVTSAAAVINILTAPVIN